MEATGWTVGWALQCHTVYRHRNATPDTFWENPHFEDLMAQVDAWQGDPTPADVRHLARRYGDTVPMVERLFRTRVYRQQAATRSHRLGKQCAVCRQWKRRRQFLSDRRSSDLMQATCIECKNRSLKGVR